MLLTKIVTISLVLSAGALQAQDKAAINWFEPAGGKAGDQITVSYSHIGSGDSVQVFFNGLSSKIIKSYPDHLVATVPSGNVAGFISVTSPGITLTSRQKFKSAATSSSTPVSVSDKIASPVITNNKTQPSTATGSILSKAPIQLARPAAPVATPNATSVVPATGSVTASVKAAAQVKAPAAVPAASPVVSQIVTPLVAATPATKVKPVIPEVKTTAPTVPTPVVAITPVKAATPVAAPVAAPVATTAQPAEPASDKSTSEGPTLLRKSGGTPLVLSFTPKSGNAGTKIHITGINFGFDKSTVSVSIKNTTLTVSSVYDQEIVATVPESVKESGTLVVVVDGKKSASREAFKMGI